MIGCRMKIVAIKVRLLWKHPRHLFKQSIANLEQQLAQRERQYEFYSEY